MPTTAKPRKSASSRSAPSSKANSTKKASRASRTRSTSQARSTARSTRSSNPKSPLPSGEGIAEKLGSVGDTVHTAAETARDGASAIAKGAVAATVGTAVAAFAGRALIASRRQRHLLGVPIPRSHKGVKSIAKQLSGIAGELEKKSLDVSKASGRAKQAAKILG